MTIRATDGRYSDTGYVTIFIRVRKISPIKYNFTKIAATSLINCMENWNMIGFVTLTCFHHIVSRLIYVLYYDFPKFSFVWKLALYPVQWTNWSFLVWSPEIVRIVDGSYWNKICMQPFVCSYYQHMSCPSTDHLLLNYPQTSYVNHLSRQLKFWCSWSIACRRCSNYIFIRDWTPGFSGLDKDSRKTRRETFKFWYWCDLY